MGIYSSYFNFSENPFGETPDCRFYIDSNSHSFAMNQIRKSLCSPSSLTCLMGEVGTGKTLLSRLLCKTRQANQITALLLNPILNPAELLQAVAGELLPSPLVGSSKVILTQLTSTFAELTSKGHSVVLIIDEAQCLPALSIVAVLKIFEHAKANGFAFHVLLLGQPELCKVDALRDSEPLVLDALSYSDMKQYVSKRIRIAGGSGFLNFDESACKVIYRESQGLPRLINRLCEVTLLEAERSQVRSINRQLVLNTLNCWPQLKTTPMYVRTEKVAPGYYR